MVSPSPFFHALSPSNWGAKMQEILKTERLILRPFRQDDAGPVRELASNWNVARMLARVPHPYSVEDAESWIASQRQTKLEGREYAYAVEYQGEFIGSAGMVCDGNRVELGYWIGEPFWNRGFATEAVRKLAEEAFIALKSPIVTAEHFADNHASGNVLRKAGFRYTGEGKRWSEARRENVRALIMAKHKLAGAA
jgi:ribosomal-protein-alanine N-acetyltransferase